LWEALQQADHQEQDVVHAVTKAKLAGVPTAVAKLAGVPTTVAKLAGVPTTVETVA
jgi:hypothetical protein